MGTHMLWDLLGVVSVGLDGWCGVGVGIGEAKSTEVRVGGGRGQPERFGPVCIGQVLGSRPMGVPLVWGLTQCEGRLPCIYGFCRVMHAVWGGL